jgi:hypothetical protein
VRRKPTNWNDIDTSIFQRKEKRVPVGLETKVEK